ncbi:MAG: 30S ribosomal protein S1 [Clostridiales bacterium]|nr:30S ribosomal protein S1 [Clostridiales bacterium]HOA33789.1 S1 RNA-binding domain-containing protein [Clostridiales bacterium]HOL78966.1 S1 RNA-binding domain-containing protein [Clostridiales bacterium]HPP68678.1 S1 RNA-binding domain-containing protein [Clostridiales bacterium]HQA05746.1 S1 RNA-binding domain-containing protein [Clostridiales bacterium]
MRKYLPEGSLINTAENKAAMENEEALKRAMLSGTILEARAVLCDKEHNLHVNLGCMRGIIPRKEAALGIEEGTVRDIAIISRVNKPVMFKVLEIEENSFGTKTAILSRRVVQEEFKEYYTKEWSVGDIIDAKVTHMESFGAFCDIGAGISALMPVDSISVSRIPHPNVRFSVNQNIKAIIKSFDSEGRVNLSHKELLGTWLENASMFSVGETVPGIIRSVENYGIFIELTPNLAGLAEYTEGVKEGEWASVFIKSIIPEKMKIKLIIVDSFEADYPPLPIKYFYTEDKIKHFLYSPPGCEKVIETYFE